MGDYLAVIEARDRATAARRPYEVLRKEWKAFTWSTATFEAYLAEDQPL
jgi:hypothetical protein